MRLRVLTLNLWNVSEPLAPRMAALAAGLAALQPDIVCLQEVGGDPRTGRRQSRSAADACGLRHAIDHEQLSILSRFRIECWRHVALPIVPRDEPRHGLLADIQVGGRQVLIANTHLCWRPEWRAERKMQVDALLGALERHEARDATILCGDFNDDPDSPALRAVVESGLVFRDAFAVCYEGQSGYTWSRQNPYVDRSTLRDQRIDYIFCAGALTPSACAVVFNDAECLASDHYGLLATFDLP